MSTGKRPRGRRRVHIGLAYIRGLSFKTNWSWLRIPSIADWFLILALLMIPIFFITALIETMLGRSDKDGWLALLYVIIFGVSLALSLVAWLFQRVGDES